MINFWHTKSIPPDVARTLLCTLLAFNLKLSDLICLTYAFRQLIEHNSYYLHNNTYFHSTMDLTKKRNKQPNTASYWEHSATYGAHLNAVFNLYCSWNPKKIIYMMKIVSLNFFDENVQALTSTFFFHLWWLVLHQRESFNCFCGQCAALNKYPLIEWFS